ncbi:regulator of replication initiation timing [Flavobacterium arsenatis]|uniref:Regulator of replication initiation timing n=1 Tax=Flavobacterium arsenatis TaxID=1484332 RepID=A0ABU1TJT2_9FLAO|nr:DUF2339 domain-containing protein [Flavobacterium arsenatis]MDR6966244.1 regulator of replication initiation timing [Flavobacterium arsenatis]
MVIFCIVIIICILVLFSNLTKLRRETDDIKFTLGKNTTENNALRKEIDELKKVLVGKNITTETFEAPQKENRPWEVETIPKPVKEIVPEEQNLPIAIVEEIAVVENTANEEIIKEEVTIQLPETVAPVHFERKSAPVLEKEVAFEQPIKEESSFSILLKNIEKQFADNWTGILGTAIMVLGIGYLSIYTALKVEPLFRVLILWLYSGLLVGSYYVLQKKEKWTKTGLWLRSAGASLFLFGCFGASQIPALAFITNNYAGYALIGLGISLNLYVGYIIKQQTFLSLHVILSILVLCVIPEKMLITFILAAITSTTGIILSYKEKWEYHLLIVIIAFIIFDIWFNAEGSTLSATQNIIAILGIITVAGSCMFMQYRSVYENTRFEKSAFITHLTNWILFALGLILHSTGSPFKTFVLFAGAIICFIIALRARKRKIYWLYHLDGMVAFVLFALSIIMLNDWNIGIDIIACILYLTTAVCLFVVYSQKEILLYKIFLGINHFLAVALIVFSVLMISNSLEPSKITNITFSIISLTVISLGVAVFSAFKKDFLSIDALFGSNELSLNGVLSLVLSVFVVLNWNSIYGNSFYYVLISIALIWCFLKMKLDTKTFDIGRLFFFGSSLFVGIILLNVQEKSYLDVTLAFAFLSVSVFNWTVPRFYNNNTFLIRFLSVLGINALLLVLSFKYLSQHQILQIFSLFGIALLNHEFLWFTFKTKKLENDNQTLLYIFYFVFIGIGSLLFLNHSPNLDNSEIGLTCLGITIIESYALFAKRLRNASNETIGGWKNFNLLNSEFVLFNALLFGFACLKIDYTTVYLLGLAIISFIAFTKFEEFKRYSIYSFIIVLGGIIATLFLAIANLQTTDKTLIYIVQISSIFLSAVYSYLQYTSEKGNSKTFASTLNYIQNIWIILLLFIQVETSYLPLCLMVLALVNYGLIASNRIKISLYNAPIIGMLGIAISVFHSISKLNNFEIIDWLLQLGSVGLAIVLVVLLHKKSKIVLYNADQVILNIWVSVIMFSQLDHKWLLVYWAITAIVNVFLYHKKISKEKSISIIYYLLANIHLGILSFNFYEARFLPIYLLIFALLGIYVYLAYKWMEAFKLKNSLLIYTATLSIGCFLFLTFDKGILTFFWILEALGLLILGIILKEKYFRYVSLSLVGICVIRLMFFDLSNTDFLIRALVLVGVGVVLIIMNSLFKKYKDRFD